MLDDLAYINQVDKSGALDIALKEPDQLLYEFNFVFNGSVVKNVVYAAMGGSALAASLSETWPGYKVPFEIVRDYVLPNYVSNETLCIISSYSGNTEETLSALEDAEKKQAQIVIITGGGKLKDIAEEKKYPLLILPAAKQPRYAVFYNLKALLEVIVATGISSLTSLDQLKELAECLRKEANNWQEIIPVQHNLAKQIALDCLGKSVVIYAGPKLKPSAYKWKISFNENAKHIAWTGTYSEFNHNEFIGWSEQPVDKPYSVIDLRSSLEDIRIQKRFALSDKLLSGRRPAALVVNLKGETLVEQLLYAVVLGDFVTLYTAIAGGINPEPVELVERFKKLLTDQE